VTKNNILTIILNNVRAKWHLIEVNPALNQCLYVLRDCNDSVAEMNKKTTMNQ